MHHLTYERSGEELPEDLEHICIICHAMAHPSKAADIIDWEIRRQRRIGMTDEQKAEETEEERREMEFAEQEAEEAEYERDMNAAAWNLGKYTASGYCIADVEAEERRRRGE